MQTIQKTNRKGSTLLAVCVVVFSILAFLSFAGMQVEAEGNYSGLTQIGSNLYYYDPVTHQRVSGWVTVDGNSYYFHDTQYTALKNIQIIDGKYYFFDNTTYARQIGICKTNSGSSYLFQEDGTLAKGLITYNGDLYYMRPTRSGEVQLGLNSVNGVLYYFDVNTGKAIKNQSIVIEHIIYNFGPNYEMTSYAIEEGYENDARTKFVYDSLQYLGYTYSLYGDGGFSCGGYVSQICINQGIEFLPQNASWGHAYRLNQLGMLHEFDLGVTDVSVLKPGDMIFWKWDDASCQAWREREGLPMPCPHANMDEIHHVAIYIGNGLTIECAEGENGVVIRELRETSTLTINFYGSFLGDADNQISYPLNFGADTAGNRVSLSWNIADDTDGYLLYRRELGAANSSYQLLHMFSDNMVTEYTDYTEAGKTYNYMLYSYKYIDGTMTLSRAACVDATGSSAAADTIAVATIPAGVVCNPRVTGTNYGTVSLAWDAVAGADGYLIYGKTESGTYGYIGMTTQGTTYTHTGASGSEYNFYWVFAFEYDENNNVIAGPNPYYVYAKAKTLGVVQNIRAQGQTGKVALSWDSVADADGYLIYGKTASGEYGYIGMTTQGTTFNHTGASTTEYNFYWVYAFRYDANNQVDQASMNTISPTYAYAKAL